MMNLNSDIHQTTRIFTVKRDQTFTQTFAWTPHYDSTCTFNSTRLLRLLGHQTMTVDTHFAPYKACLGARLPLPIIMGKFSLLNYRGQHFENLQKIILDEQIDIEGPSTWLYREVCPNRLCVAGSRSQVIEGSPTRLLQQANIKTPL